MCRSPDRLTTALRIPLGIGVVLVAAGSMTLAGPRLAEGDATTVTPPYGSNAPTVDGRPDEPAWRDAAVLRQFWLPDTRLESATPTEVRLLRDDRSLYVAFLCIEPPAPDAERASPLRDHVTVEVDSSTSRAYGTFTVNEDGQQFENGILRGDDRLTWRGAAAPHDGGWTAELAIPLVSLVGNEQGSAPRIDFIRYRAAAREWSRWGDPSTSGQAPGGGRLVLTGPPPPAAALSAAAGSPPPVVSETGTGGQLGQWGVPPLPTSPSRRPPGFDPPRSEAQADEPQVSRLAPAAGGAYVLQRGDLLEVKHFHNPELNEELPIRPDGRISLELVGEVQAAGLAVGDLRAILRQRYATFVREPEVAVIVKAFGGNRVYIGGEVTQPGVLETNGQLTVLQAIFQAGGFLRTAELRNVVVLRNQGTAKPAFLTFDLKDSLTKAGEHLNDRLLQPYDIVYVPKSRVARMGDFVDQYIDELIPLPVTLGLSYLFR